MTSAIRFEDVSVRYRVPKERIGSLKEYAIRRMKRRMAYDDFEALRDVSLEIFPGETVGVVGRNGAGKSTLLKLVAQVVPPTDGRVIVVGRIAPLLELGLGLHGELTGRENVLLQGALLAFAVATDVDPDILLVDEALSVGDERFQLKCLDRMESFRRAGKTVLLVSHALAQVRDNCRRAVWIHEGRLVRDGDAASVTAAYHDWSVGGESSVPSTVPVSVPAASS